MALWNHLVPDLVELSVKERDMDKLPHSRYPSSLPENDEDSEPEMDKNKKNTEGGQNPAEEDHATFKVNKEFSPPPQRTPTYGRDRIAEVKPGPYLMAFRYS